MFDQYSIFLVAYEPRVANGQSQHQYPHDPYCGQLLPNELEPYIAHVPETKLTAFYA